MRTVYYVAEEDPTKAQAIIAEIMAPNEKVEAYGLLPEAAVKALSRVSLEACDRRAATWTFLMRAD